MKNRPTCRSVRARPSAARVRADRGRCAGVRDSGDISAVEALPWDPKPSAGEGPSTTFKPAWIGGGLLLLLLLHNGWTPAGKGPSLIPLSTGGKDRKPSAGEDPKPSAGEGPSTTVKPVCIGGGLLLLLLPPFKSDNGWTPAGERPALITGGTDNTWTGLILLLTISRVTVVAGSMRRF